MLGFLSVIIMLLTISVVSIVLFARNTAIKGTEINRLFAYAESIVDVNFRILTNYLIFESLIRGNQGVTFFVFDSNGDLVFPKLSENMREQGLCLRKKTD